ncbi:MULTISPECIES: IMPACT family protein [Rheinheimera]|uniref:IMPACT family protein n=1 Tax=Rheinheimera marina TaxID=1774958 RepID=A0ABV9JQK0_9GAMM
MSGCWLLAATASSEQEIKRSRFLCTLWPVSSLEQGQVIIQQQKQLHSSAAHVCSAMLLAPGPTGQPAASSDDGEPSGTAGRPMLAVLQGSGLAGVCATVVRYYGGIQLGTGGLVRAYSDAVRQALLVAERRFQPELIGAELELSYPAFEAMQRQWGNVWQLESQQFQAVVQLKLALPKPQQAEFEDDLMRYSDRQASLRWLQGQ